MKKKLFFLFGIANIFSITAQNTNPSIEKALYGIQAGTFGVWANRESRLSSTIALRAEVGSHLFSEEALIIIYTEIK